MLTEKELQILLLRKEGLLQKEIAERLGVHQSVISRVEANAHAKITQALADIALLDAAGIKYDAGNDDTTQHLRKLKETLRRLER